MHDREPSTGIDGAADAASPPPLVLGSPAHKELFCRMLLDTAITYDPERLAWPDASPELRQRLTSLPFWDLAVETEGEAGARMAALAETTGDPLLREAIARNAFEERRHKAVLHALIAQYGIALEPERPYPPPRRPRWAFLRTGYGECFDSFFAFGLFALARRSGFFPAELVAVFEPVIQEEARHNIFFVNWVAYTARRLPLAGRPRFAGERLAAVARQVWARASTAGAVDGDNFTRTGAAASGIDLDARSFLLLCLSESERRFAPYDARLLRPLFMPRLVGALCRLWPRPRGAAA